jgi:hypothetical protein
MAEYLVHCHLCERRVVVHHFARAYACDYCAETVVSELIEGLPQTPEGEDRQIRQVHSVGQCPECNMHWPFCKCYWEQLKEKNND